jgi:hypothetical protein
MSKSNARRNDDSLVVVRICGPTEAEMIREMLANNGIDCTLQGENAAEALPATSDLDEVRVWVRPEDLAAARDIVDAFFTPVGKDELQEGEDNLGVDNPDEPGGFTV